MPRLSLAQRIRIARKHAAFATAEDLAARITAMTGEPISSTQIEALEAGTARLSGRLVHIALACKIRPEWLVLSDGAMTEDGEESDLDYRSAPLSDQELEMLTLWRQQPVDMRQHYIELMRRMALPMSPGYQATESIIRKKQSRR